MLELIQSYYKFLHLWMYIDHLLKKWKIKPISNTIKIKTWKSTYFKINNNIVNDLIYKINSNSDKPNIYGYIVQYSGFKWIFSTTIEILDENKDFGRFIYNLLKNQYFDFVQIVKFLRNILIHSTSLDIKIKKEDFEKQQDYLFKENKLNLKLSINYSKIFGKIWKWNSNYGFEIKINFWELKEGQKLTEIVSLQNLYLLSEFIYNISVVYKNV